MTRDQRRREARAPVRARARPARARVSSTTTSGSGSGARVGAASTSAAAAPRSLAAARKSWPSKRSPRRATNSSPVPHAARCRSTRREKRRRRRACCAAERARAASAEAHHRPLRSRARRAPPRASENGWRLPGDLLVVLVSLARDQDDVGRRRAWRSPLRSRARGRARSPRAARRCRRAICAMIACGSSLRGLSLVTHHAVGEARGDRAHQRPLAGSRSPPQPNTHDQAAAARARDGAQRLQRLVQRIRRVRVVDDELVVSVQPQGYPPDASWLPTERVAEADSVLADSRWPVGAQRLFDAAAAAGKPSVFDGDAGDVEQVRATAAAATHPFLSQSMLQSFELGEPKDALPRLFGGRNVVCGVTLGAAGVIWFDGQRVQSAPSPRVKAIDTLAAGDTWHGAFALALAERQQLDAAIAFATAVAALKCTRFGGRAGIPYREEFEQWWASVRVRTQFAQARYNKVRQLWPLPFMETWPAMKRVCWRQPRTSRGHAGHWRRCLKPASAHRHRGPSRFGPA